MCGRVGLISKVGHACGVPFLFLLEVLLIWHTMADPKLDFTTGDSGASTPHSCPIVEMSTSKTGKSMRTLAMASDSDLGKEIDQRFATSEDIMVSVLSAMGEEHAVAVKQITGK
uniref:Translation initiation factor 5A C-terminal domain-containing protein n=1 Tax=Oncorhynchus kisutch TaxID=8019 RepID=A0A8C7EYI7_ONCKI